MARERGFAVTIKAWVPVRGNDATSVASAALAANGTNNDLHGLLIDQGFVDVEITSTFTSKKKPDRIEIDDRGLFAEPALNELLAATQTPSVGLEVPDSPHLAEAVPDDEGIPPFLDRREPKITAGDGW